MLLAVLAVGAVAALSVPGSVAVAGLILLGALFLVPVWSLPAIAFLAFAFLPVGYLNSVPEVVGRFLSPAVIVLWVYVLRWKMSGGVFRMAVRWPALILVLGMVALALIGINPLRSLFWVFVFVGAALAPSVAATGSDQRAREALSRTWLATGGLLGFAAVFESATHLNPLGRFYDLDQHWSVYRVTTTLGHPLLNGTFFAVTACFALFTALQATGRRWPLVVVFVVTGCAAALSGSRSAVVALGVGLGVGLVLSLLSRKVSAASKVAGIVLIVAAMVLVPNLPTFAQRAGSAEAGASTAYRDAVLRLGINLIEQRPLFGGGPGTSALLAEQTGAQLPLESAVLGTVVSLGIVGATGFVLWLAWLARACIRNHRPEALTGITAFLTAGAAFPLWETNPAAWVLVGLLMLLAGGPRDPATRVPPFRNRVVLTRPSLEPSSVGDRSRTNDQTTARAP